MNFKDATLIQIVRDSIKYVIHMVTAKQIAQPGETVNGQKFVMMITKFADQNVVKMMIVRVRFVMKPGECVCLVITRVN